jgi:hypothetical protein
MGERTSEKGTQQILWTFKQLKLNYDIIMGRPWKECMIRKAKCHIFVDQISCQPDDIWDLPKDWKGGLGKSGLEAMLLRCLTISRGNFQDYDIPKPPVVECLPETLKDILEVYVKDENKRLNKIKEQYEWAKTYLDPDFCAKRILNEMIL